MAATNIKEGELFIAAIISRTNRSRMAWLSLSSEWDENHLGKKKNHPQNMTDYREVTVSMVTTLRSNRQKTKFIFTSAFDFAQG